MHRFLIASLLFAVLLVGSSYATTFDARVVRVVDGDSLIVLVDQQQQLRVRLKEIDAPELKQPFGKRSRQSLADLCATKRARVMWTEKDRHGRALGRVWCGEVDANAEQVREEWPGCLTATWNIAAYTHCRIELELTASAFGRPGSVAWHLPT